MAWFQLFIQDGFSAANGKEIRRESGTYLIHEPNFKTSEGHTVYLVFAHTYNAHPHASLV